MFDNSFRLNLFLQFDYLFCHLLYARAGFSLIDSKFTRECRAIQLKRSINERHNVLDFWINQFANGENQVAKNLRLDFYSQILIIILEGFNDLREPEAFTGYKKATIHIF